MKLAVMCAASQCPDPGEVLIDTHDPTAIQSNLIHRAIAFELTGREYPGFVGPDAVEMEGLVAKGVEWFDTKGIDPEYAGYKVEVEANLSFGNISGTLDVRVPAKFIKKTAIVDWKNTYRDDDHEAQLLTYAWLEFMDHEWCEAVDLYVAYLRLGVVDHKVVTREWVMAWMAEFMKNSYGGVVKYHAGDHCERCPRQFVCQALLVLNRQTVSTLMGMGTDSMAVYLNPGLIAELHPKVKLLKQVIEAYGQQVRAQVLKGGPIPLESGKELRTLTINKETILPLQAWELLESEFSEGEMAQLIKVPKSAVEEIIGSKAKRGTKKATVDAFLDSLRLAGAMEKKVEIQIREMNTKEVS